MDLEKYNKNKNIIYAVQFIITAAAVITIFLISGITASLITLCSCIVIIIMTALLVRTDDRFITDTVSDLSKLIDTLSELEDKNIFPQNADTIVSKIQNKVIRLSRVLKKKNADSIQEQENIKGLVSDISHQLKTPISNLKMYSEFLLDETVTPEQRKEYVNIIVVSIERLNFLSESMIKISRLESGLININPVAQSLNETVLKSIKNVFAKAKNKNVEITFSGSEKITVLHDRNWTAEAIFNLLDNAVKYSDEGRSVDITLKKLGIFACIEISDHNDAIPEAEYTKIFQRFYRGENSKKHEGIGVGLYLAREIALKQNGYINLRSHKDGNTFSLFLPVCHE